MENDDDFTFCQVGAPVDRKDGIEEPDLVAGVSGIKIKDQPLEGDDTKGNSGVVWNDKLQSNANSEKQLTSGSLNFKVIDASMINRVTDSSRQALEGAQNSVKTSEEKKTSFRKPAPRAKVPFEKGYSQMDWLKLTRTHPDLAGLRGQSNKRLISLSEVKQHQTGDAMWTVLKGRVYNIAPYMKFHPGGVDMLMKAVGKDSTALFNKYHAWVNFEFLLEECLVGILDDSK